MKTLARLLGFDSRDSRSHDDSKASRQNPPPSIEVLEYRVLPAASLFKDINVGGGDSAPADFAVVAGKIFFAASDGINGRELWISDGTPAGTKMLWDIYPGVNPGVGPLSSNPSGFVSIGDTVYFQANDGGNGIELWKSDGTAAGTTIVKDINFGGDSNPSELVVLGNTLYFSADDGGNGTELWKSDGTNNGTAMVKNINLIFAGGAELGSDPRDLLVVGGTLYFQADDGMNGKELWKSDGTAAGTVLVKDIQGNGSSSPDGLTAVGHRVYFAGV